MAAVSTILMGSALALSAGSTAYSMYSDRKAGKAAKKQASFEAGILEEQADDVLEAGREAGFRVGVGARGLKGSQTASLAAQGLDVRSGSAADVIENDERLAQMDILQLENNAAREALGLRKQAELVRMGGQNTAQSYTNRGTGTLLSGAAQLYGIYSAYGQNRTPRKAPSSVGNTPSGGTN